MPQINILPKHIAELIAAGEVVERPASVVKEIMENAIDAGADKITLEIQRGGITYIRITDNGCGIDRANIRKAFISHATSKISVADDLNSIYTLGFRGEALASIAAVSRVEIMTRTVDENIGTRYCVEGGREVLLDDAGCPEGTTLIVRDLFYNTPARMKFLKKDVSEANAVAGVVDRIALSHPDISVRFIRDGKDALFTPGDGSLKNTVQAVLGRDFASTLIETSYELDGVKVYGFISKPINSRPNRTMQYFFLNGRFIKTRTGMVALEEAYKNQIMTGKFPACILNIEASAQSVDVNVHPAKTEVRFENEKKIFNAVYYCAKSALQTDNSRAQINIQQKTARQFIPEPMSGSQMKLNNSSYSASSAEKSDNFWVKTTADRFVSDATEKRKPEIIVHRPAVATNVTFCESRDTVGEFSDSTEIKNETTEAEQNCKINSVQEENIASYEQENDSDKVPDLATEPFRVIGEAFKTYIIVEQGEKLLIIDKHAAHERMLFEKLRSSQGETETQLLLVPVTVTLSKQEYDAVLDNLDLLKKSGYKVEDFGNGMVTVSECPTAVADADLDSVIMELAGYLADNKKELVPNKLDWIYHSTACRAAIKAGDRTSEYEMNKFVESLLSNPEIKFCPHGRPVIVEMTKKEIEKNFGRIQ